MKAENKKIAKGYRLKPETHEIINELKKAVRGDTDFAISIACRKFLNEMKSINKIKEKLT